MPDASVGDAALKMILFTESSFLLVFSIALSFIASWVYAKRLIVGSYGSRPTSEMDFKLRPVSYLNSRIIGLWRQTAHRFHDQLDGLMYLVRGPSIIDKAYIECGRRPFAISTPSNRHIMVASSTFVRELANAPNSVLSLHAAAKEILQPKYTMRGFEWQDERGVEGIGFVRALRSLLTSNLPTLLPRLQKTLEQSLDDEIQSSHPDRQKGDTHLVNVFPSVKKVVARTNCVMFFGQALSENDEFVAAALRFPQDVIFAAELLRLSPAVLAPLVAYLATRGHRAAETLVRHLRPVVEARMRARQASLDEKDSTEAIPSSSHPRLRTQAQAGGSDDKPVDCMQWIIDTSPRKQPWSTGRMIGEVIALWFSSVHQLAMAASFALDHLCCQPGAVELLRAELEAHADMLPSPLSSPTCRHLDDLPLLNSFVMETFRVSSTDAVSCRREALAAFTFSDGTAVRPGDWACIPLAAILRDPLHFAEPKRFDLQRFVQPGLGAGSGVDPDAHAAMGRLIDTRSRETLDYSDPARLTDVTAKWPVWGIGKTACPGRFYASHTLKMLLVHVLQNYDVQMVAERRLRSATWRSSIVPLASARLAFTRRRK